MRIAGADPGTRPVIAIIDTGTGRLAVYDDLAEPRQVNGRGTHIPDPERIRFALEEGGVDRLVLENVWMRPTTGPKAQGAVSQARLVSCMHLIWGVAVGLGIPVDRVVPQTWKADAGLRGSDKELSRQRCLKLLPASAPLLKRKSDHNRAEGLLLARYGTRAA